MLSSLLRSLKHRLVVLDLALPDYARRPYEKLLNLSKVGICLKSW